MLNSATSIDQAPPVWTLSWTEIIREGSEEGSEVQYVERAKDVSKQCNTILNDIKENCWKPFKAETRVTMWTPVMNAKGSLQKLGAIVSVLAREVFTLGICGYWAQRRDAIEGILKSFDKSCDESSQKIFRESGISATEVSIRCSIAGREEVDFNTLVTRVLKRNTINRYACNVGNIATNSTVFGASILACLFSYALLRVATFRVATVFGGLMLLNASLGVCMSLYLLWRDYSNAPAALPDQPLTIEEMKQSPFQLKDDNLPYLQFFEASNFASNVPPAL